MKLNGTPELGDASIDVYQDKRLRWRWRFLVYCAKHGSKQWDIQACSTESFLTAADAEYNAIGIICKPWEVQVEYLVELPWWQKLLNFFRR